MKAFKKLLFFFRARFAAPINENWVDENGNLWVDENGDPWTT